MSESFGGPARAGEARSQHRKRLWLRERSIKHLRVGGWVAGTDTEVTCIPADGTFSTQSWNHRCRRGKQGRLVHIRDSDDRNCPCCLMPYESYELMDILPCKHRFHARCLERWLQEKRQLRCPLCTQEFQDRSCAPICTCDLSSCWRRNSNRVTLEQLNISSSSVTASSNSPPSILLQPSIQHHSSLPTASRLVPREDEATQAIEDIWGLLKRFHRHL
jgi:hypothetical protein